MNRKLLTKKEAQVMDFVSSGYTDGEIAIQLNRSRSTITTHVKNVCTKLKVTNRVQAISEMMRLDAQGIQVVRK